MQPLAETVVCQKRTSTHRIVFMGMMNELAVSPSTQPSERHSCLWPRWAIQTRFLDFRQTRIRKDLGSSTSEQTEQPRRKLGSQGLSDYGNSHRIWAAQPSRNDDLRAKKEVN